jgi:IclR family acetate operon transcriptional repressor
LSAICAKAAAKALPRPRWSARRDLRREIALTRKRGYGRTGSEYSVGIEGLACAAMAGGEVIGAFAVAIPAVRFDDGVERRVADLLMRTAGLLDG